MRIGAQFFTLRDYCKDLESFSESLKKVADIGYKYVQISGTCAYEPDWLKAELDKNGLECVLTHIPVNRLCESPTEVAREHDVFNCKYIGLGWYDFTKEDIKGSISGFVDKFTAVADVFKAHNKTFMYHNHAMEFRKLDNKPIIQHLSELMPAEDLMFILDTYWIQKAGGDPAYWIEKFKDRIPCIHLKDCTWDSKMAVVGEGNINFEKAFEKAEASNVKYMLVEQDDCNGENPFDCLERSYKNLNAYGFE